MVELTSPCVGISISINVSINVSVSTCAAESHLQVNFAVRLLADLVLPGHQDVLVDLLLQTFPRPDRQEERNGSH